VEPKAPTISPAKKSAVVYKTTSPASPRSRTRTASVPAPQPRIAPPRLEPHLAPLDPSLTARREIEFLPTNFTPYDSYLGPVRTVMARLDVHPASMITACDLVATGRHFRYLMSDPYRAQLPATTDARRAGDCKSKALWLYDHLGDPSAYYVIGKLQRGSHTSHAWVYWRNEGRWWILDPTDRFSPVAADSVSSGRYVPYYSYSRAGAFRHSATRIMMAANGGIPVTNPAVAVGGRAK
jgi:hypothetical protein